MSAKAKPVWVLKESNEEEYVVGQIGPETRKGIGVVFPELGDKVVWFPQKAGLNMMTSWASGWFAAHGTSVFKTAALLAVPDWMWEKKLLPKVAARQNAARKKNEAQGGL